jgi:hypothetical protein
LWRVIRQQKAGMDVGPSSLTGEHRLTGITKANDGVTALTRFTRNKSILPRFQIEREKAQLAHAAGMIVQPNRTDRRRVTVA